MASVRKREFVEKQTKMMDKEHHGLVNLNQQKQSSLRSKVPYIASLSFSTIVLIGTFVVSGLANYPDPEKVGFKNKTGQISDMYYTSITPAGWAFSIWGIIYAWQALWTVYGWSLVIRRSFPLTISHTTLVLYGCANIGNIIWIYVWGNELPQYSFPVLVVIAALLYSAIGFEAVFLYKNTSVLESLQKFKVDVYLARGFVLNGLVIYATWASIATLINFTVVLEYYADMSSADAGTVGLSLLALEVIIYFTLENTVLDSYVRPVVMVYPVVIWALSALINAHWGNDDDERTNIFALILLILSVSLFVARIILLIVFAFVRPIKYPNANLFV